MTSDDIVTVSATETSLRIVEGIHDLQGAGISELARHLDLPKSTVHNHVRTLYDAEYLVTNDGDYDLGLRFLEFGDYVRKYHQFIQIGSSEAEKLAEQTGERVNLTVEEHGRGVYVFKANGSEAVHMDTYAGKRVPLHATAFGKAILSQCPATFVDDIIDRHGLPSLTSQTITDADELHAQLEMIDEQGYAVDQEERLEGVSCVAAPIVVEGEVRSAISVSGPKSRIQGDALGTELPDLVTNAAEVVRINITYADQNTFDTSW